MPQAVPPGSTWNPRRTADGASCRAAPETTELEFAWTVCSDLFNAAVRVKEEPTDRRLFEEVIFCIVGGFGVGFEHALSVTNKVLGLGVAHPAWRDETLKTRLTEEFGRRQFEPPASDGSVRRYRYSSRKADLIVRARSWLLQRPGLVGRLQSVQPECRRRAELMQCPGLGPKSASWALRNVGLATELAILDVHIMRALRTAGRITVERLPRDYELVEASFLAWCRDLGAPPAAFDLFVWEWQRGSLTA